MRRRRTSRPRPSSTWRKAFALRTPLKKARVSEPPDPVREDAPPRLDGCRAGDQKNCEEDQVQSVATTAETQQVRRTEPSSVCQTPESVRKDVPPRLDGCRAGDQKNCEEDQVQSVATTAETQQVRRTEPSSVRQTPESVRKDAPPCLDGCRDGDQKNCDEDQVPSVATTHETQQVRRTELPSVCRTPDPVREDVPFRLDGCRASDQKNCDEDQVPSVATTPETQQVRRTELPSVRQTPEVVEMPLLDDSTPESQGGAATQRPVCPVCSANFAGLAIVNRETHVRQCREDEAARLDPVERRNYACPLCDTDLSRAHADAEVVLERVGHLKRCAKARGARLEDLRCAAVNAEPSAPPQTPVSARARDKGPRNALAMLMESGGRARQPVRRASRHRLPAPIPTRQPPVSKRIPGAKGFVVDGFHFAGLHYFLTHFHADHYMGLRAGFAHGTIYCTPSTRALVCLRLGVAPERIKEIRIGGPPLLVQGVVVHAVDANHCPGAAMFVFHVRRTKQAFLHCGDCRYDRGRIPLRKLWPPGLPLRTVFLDTTYCAPSYNFMPQSQAIDEACEHARSALRAETEAGALGRYLGAKPAEGTTLFLFGTYSIGKERLFLGVVERCFPPAEPICVSQPKLRMLRCCADSLGEQTLKRFTTDPAGARVRVVDMGKLRMDRLRVILSESMGRFRRVVAFRPTGWAGATKVASDRSGSVKVVSVPYSEHSSFSELADLIRDARHIAPGCRFVATVNHSSCAPHLDALLASPRPPAGASASRSSSSSY